MNAPQDARHSWTGPMQTVMLVLTDDPVPRDLQPKLSRDLENDCFEVPGEALPKRRYASAQALAETWTYLKGKPILSPGIVASGCKSGGGVNRGKRWRWG